MSADVTPDALRATGEELAAFASATDSPLDWLPDFARAVAAWLEAEANEIGDVTEVSMYGPGVADFMLTGHPAGAVVRAWRGEA